MQSDSVVSYGTFNGNVRISPANDEAAVTKSSTLSVLNLTYDVQTWVGPWWKGACFRRRRLKTVLDNISLHVKSGEITAILGNSGSGKTSLLDVIACRSSGKVKGHVYFNNRLCTRDVIKSHATYVMQADRLLPNLTVRETLLYTARLKLPRRTTNKEIEYKVHRVIMEMGLKEVADSRVGGSIIRGISGGEQRRVTIAIQLLKDPDMILLDEPTSGLDSYTARNLVSSLRNLARRGKIVLLTIHQPSSDIFGLFDQISIMSHGHVVYSGGAKEMVPYFTKLGYPCDKYTNPLDRYVDVASIDRRDHQRERDSFERVDSLVEEFKKSAIHLETQRAIEEETMKRSSDLGNGKLRGPSLPRIMLTLYSRMNKNLFRDRKDYVARIFLLPLFMVFILIFLGRLQHNQHSIQDRVGLIYQCATVPPFMGIINSVALFPPLRNLYYRECRDGLYGILTFLVSYAAHVLPFMAVASVIFGSVVFWAVGMNPEPDRFGLFTLEIFILHFWGEMVCVLCMGLFMNSNLANSVAALLQAASVVIASGLLKNVQTLIKPFQWLSWGLIHKYVAEIFIANEFRGLNFTCDNPVPSSCLYEGDVYIDLYYPEAYEHMARNFGAIVAYAAGTLLLAALAFKIGGLKNLH